MPSSWGAVQADGHQESISGCKRVKSELIAPSRPAGEGCGGGGFPLYERSGFALKLIMFDGGEGESWSHLNALQRRSQHVQKTKRWLKPGICARVGSYRDEVYRLWTSSKAKEGIHQREMTWPFMWSRFCSEVGQSRSQTVFVTFWRPTSDEWAPSLITEARGWDLVPLRWNQLQLKATICHTTFATALFFLPTPPFGPPPPTPRRNHVSRRNLMKRETFLLNVFVLLFHLLIGSRMKWEWNQTPARSRSASKGFF